MKLLSEKEILLQIAATKELQEITPDLLFTLKSKLRGKNVFIDPSFHDDKGRKAIRVDYVRVYFEGRDNSDLLENISLWDGVRILQAINKAANLKQLHF